MDYRDQQLNRFANTPRRMGQPGAPTMRPGKVVSAGTRGDTAAASFWNVEILSQEFAPVDVNINDRYGTGAPVVTVLMNVAAPVGAGYSSGATVSVSIPQAMQNSLLTADTTAGRLMVPSDGCFIVSGGGGASSCAIGVNAFGVYTG